MMQKSNIFLTFSMEVIICGIQELNSKNNFKPECLIFLLIFLIFSTFACNLMTNGNLSILFQLDNFFQDLQLFKEETSMDRISRFEKYWVRIDRKVSKYKMLNLKKLFICFKQQNHIFIYLQNIKLREPFHATLVLKLLYSQS